MKRFFKIFIIVAVVLLAFMIAVPVIFKDDIMTKSKEVINKQLNAKVEFSGFKLSLFRHFPDLSVGIENLSISGKDQFENDTLVKFDSFNAKVDLISLLSKKMKVKGVFLVKPEVMAKVAADSAVNWDIMVEKEEVSDEEIDTTESEMDFRVELKTLEISNGKIIYSDEVSGLQADSRNLDFILKGDLGADSSSLDIQMDVNPVLISMGGVNYVNDAAVNFKAGIGANIKDGRYHFLENQLALNELQLNFDGLIEMQEENRINTNIDFFTNQASFKELLSLIPVIYKKDFEEIQTEGNLSLNGKVSGYYQDDVLPSLDMNLLVEDAMFSYPDLPKKVSNVNISMQTYFNGIDYDKSVVNLEKFHMELANNPFDATFRLSTPVSDPEIRGEMVGKIDLADFTDVIPMEDTEFKGFIDSDLQIDGKMSMVEQENYAQFKSDGRILIQDFFLSTPDLPASFSISSAEFLFSPQYLELKSFDSKLGSSDMQVNGKIDNYLSYLLEDGVLRGDFTLSSGYFNTNEFITDSETEEMPETVDAELELFEVPERIDFKLQSRFDKIIYDKMNIDNAKGLILVKDRKIYLEDFNMNLFDGSLMADGEYSTADPDNPYVNFDFSVQSLKVDYALQSFSMLDSLAPVLRNTTGDMSLDIQYMSALQQNMQPDLSTINGYGQFRSKQLVFSGSETLSKMLRELNLTKSDKHVLRNTKVDFLMEEGRLMVKPFDVEISNIDMNISGSQGLDKTMNYLVKMDIPRGRLGDAAEEQINSLISNAIGKDVDLSAGKTIKVNAKITGTYKDPQFNFLFGEGEKGQTSLKDQVKEEVEKEIDKKKDEAEDKVREEASERAEQIIQNAEERAEKINAEAKRAADRVREEAEKRAQQLLKEAEGKNFLVKKAAEESAKKIKEEADKKANQIETEAEKQADKIIEQARQKAKEIEKEN
ncbi:MAG: AsmA-like C-terminal region-containing protein [Bacteroidales bacterium]